MIVVHRYVSHQHPDGRVVLYYDVQPYRKHEITYEFNRSASRGLLCIDASFHFNPIALYTLSLFVSALEFASDAPSAAIRFK